MMDLDSARPGSERVSWAEEEPVFLQLEWTPIGHTMQQFYYGCGTGQILWTKPAEPARVLDLDSLGQQVQLFADNVHKLQQLEQAQPAAIGDNQPDLTESASTLTTN